jgi:hypothetical protein
LDSQAGENRGRATQIRPRGVFLAVVAIAIVCILGLFAYLSWQEYLRSPKLFGELEPDDSRAANYSLSPNQSAILAELGYPDAFQILFFAGEANGTSLKFRLETWTYFVEGRELTYLDGDLVSEDMTEGDVGEPIETPYRPEQFRAMMEIGELIASTGIEEYIVVPVEKELVDGGEVYYAEELTFGMKDGRLLYVETLPLSVEVA